MTAPNNRRQDTRLVRLLRAAARVREARDRELRPQAEDALDLAERRHLRDEIVVAEVALLALCTPARATRRVRCCS